MPVSPESLNRLGRLIGESIYAAREYPPEERDEFIGTVIKTAIELLIKKGMPDEEIDLTAASIAEDLWRRIAIDQLHRHILDKHSKKPPPG